MFGIKIVSTKRWNELNKLLELQAHTICKASEALDKVVSTVTEACDKVVKNEAHS